jgi:Coenzyme PQQ synthesis protein D (PqqD)
MHYRQRAGLTVQSVDEETLILDLNANLIHQLNPTASFIWRHCEGATSAAEFARLFADHFGVDMETAANDVATILRQLCQLDLIETA